MSRLKLKPRKITPRIAEKTHQASFRPKLKKQRLPKAPIIIGLTGSIAMGKSTLAQMCRDYGLPVHDSDQTVHDLYKERNGAATQLFAKDRALSKAIITDSKTDQHYISRSLLRELLLEMPEMKTKIEAIIHPLISVSRNQFIHSAQAQRFPAVVLDIPLLFEVGLDDICDFLLVASCHDTVQEQRLKARSNISPERAAFFIKNQMPASEKRARADFIIETGAGRLHTRDQLQAALEAISEA